MKCSSYLCSRASTEFSCSLLDSIAEKSSNKREGDEKKILKEMYNTQSVPVPTLTVIDRESSFTDACEAAAIHSFKIVQDELYFRWISFSFSLS